MIRTADASGVSAKDAITLKISMTSHSADQDSKDANDPRKDKHTDNTLPGSRVFLVR
jgi:hypothetical protein